MFERYMPVLLEGGVSTGEGSLRLLLLNLLEVRRCLLYLAILILLLAVFCTVEYSPRYKLAELVPDIICCLLVETSWKRKLH